MEALRAALRFASVLCRAFQALSWNYYKINPGGAFGFARPGFIVKYKSYF
jgi:hypothetical protein